MNLLLLLLVILLVIGVFPAWPYSRDWGYFPSGTLGLILAIIIVAALMGRI
jgi:hypothetical protein